MKSKNLQRFFIFFVLCCFFVVDAEPPNDRWLGRVNLVTKPGKTFLIIFGYQSSWDEARAVCKTSGGDLASLQAEDFDLLWRSAGADEWPALEYPGLTEFWLGGYLNDLPDGRYQTERPRGTMSTTMPPPPASTSSTTNDTSGTDRVKRTNSRNGGTNWLWLSGEPIPLDWKYWSYDEPNDPSREKCLFLGDNCFEPFDHWCLFSGPCEYIGDPSQYLSLFGSICEIIEANATESTMNTTASTATKLTETESTTTESTGSKNMANVKIHSELIVLGFILISYSILID